MTDSSEEYESSGEQSSSSDDEEVVAHKGRRSAKVKHESDEEEQISPAKKSRIIRLATDSSSDDSKDVPRQQTCRKSVRLSVGKISFKEKLAARKKKFEEELQGVSGDYMSGRARRHKKTQIKSKRRKKEEEFIDDDDETPDTSDTSETMDEESPDSADEEISKKHKDNTVTVRKRVKSIEESEEDSSEANVSEETSEDETEVVRVNDCDSEADTSDEDFIVDDNAELSGEDGAEPMFYPEKKEEMADGILSLDVRQALTLVIEAMLNRAVDEEFFSSQDFLNSPGFKQAFKKIFDPFNMWVDLLKSQAWKSAFAEALEYTEYSSLPMGTYMEGCEACNKRGRYATVSVTCSGFKYDKHTLKRTEAENQEDGSDSDLAEQLDLSGVGDCQTGDEDGSNSSPLTILHKRPHELHEKMTFCVGKECNKRGELYHELRHFRWSLLESCKAKVVSTGLKEKPVSEVVEQLINDKGWVDLELTCYQTLVKRGQEMLKKRNHLGKDGEIF